MIAGAAGAQLASSLAQTYLQTAFTAFNETGNMFEKYNAQREFWGRAAASALKKAQLLASQCSVHLLATKGSGHCRCRPTCLQTISLESSCLYWWTPGVQLGGFLW